MINDKVIMKKLVYGLCCFDNQSDSIEFMLNCETLSILVEFRKCRDSFSFLTGHEKCDLLISGLLGLVNLARSKGFQISIEDYCIEDYIDESISRFNETK